MVLESFEAERLIEGLSGFPLAEVGSPSWVKQHLTLQKLNLQAHGSVVRNENNYVLEGLVSHDKLRVIVHELIVIEVWRERVLGAENKVAFEHLATNFGIRGYHTAFQEAVLCNLLEVVLYHDYAAESCGDTIIELVDYCVRRVRWLVVKAMREQNGDVEEEEALAEGNSQVDPTTEFKRQLQDIEWRCSVASVSVLRYLCEHVKMLPLGVTTRLLDTHDVPTLIIPLIENPPWTRRTERGQWEKLKDQKWEKVPPQDLLLLTPLEAQAWLILFNLLCEGEIRQRYHFHSFRKEQILRVRKYLNTTLTDQLPVLADLQRVLDELTIMDAPQPTSNTSTLIMETIAQVRDDLLGKTDWDEQQRICVEVNFKGKEKKDDPLVLQLAGLYADDEVEALLAGPQTVEQSEPEENLADDAAAGSAQGAADPALPLPAPVVPEKRALHPTVVTLFLQSGDTIELLPVTKQGTEQETSKGLFLRFQLQPRNAKSAGKTSANDENASSSGNLDVSLEERVANGSILKMNVRDSLGTVSDIYSKPLKLAKEDGGETWAKLGSLKDGAVAQVQCTYCAASGQYSFGSCFINLAKNSKLAL